MADIFISYKKEDEACARLLAGVLEQSDWSVFWDRNIPPGKIFTEVIHEELESAKCVLVLWSQAAIASGWVRDEAQVAADRGVLVPVFIEDVKAPLGFGSLEGAQLFGWDGETDHEEFQLLYREIARRIDGLETPPRPPMTPRPQKPGWLKPTGAVGLVLVAGAFLAAYRSWSSPDAATLEALVDSGAVASRLGKPQSDTRVSEHINVSYMERGYIIYFHDRGEFLVIDREKRDAWERVPDLDTDATPRDQEAADSAEPGLPAGLHAPIGGANLVWRDRKNELGGMYGDCTFYHWVWVQDFENGMFLGPIQRNFNNSSPFAVVLFEADDAPAEGDDGDAWKVLPMVERKETAAGEAKVECRVL